MGIWDLVKEVAVHDKNVASLGIFSHGGKRFVEFCRSTSVIPVVKESLEIPLGAFPMAKGRRSKHENSSYVLEQGWRDNGFEF